jgi:hypothetical protein
MASSYSTDLKLELMVTGENAGTWGDKTNTNLNLIQQAIAGYQEVSIAGGAQTTALAMTDATISNARNAVIKFTGTITGNQIVTIPDGIEKTYIISNGTTGAFTVEFKTVSGTGVTFATGDKGVKILFSDGTNVVNSTIGELSNDITPQLAGQLDVNGNAIGDGTLELLKFSETGSAVNEFTVANAATGNGPILSSTGDDTNVDININPKGTGVLKSGSSAVKIAGKETIWVPAVAMYGNTTNGADAQQVELTATQPELKALDFDPSTKEYAQFAVAFPKSWNEGTVTYQAFFTANSTNTGDVIWGLQGVAAADNDAINVAFGTAQTVTKAHSGTANDLDVSAESSAITIAGTPGVDEQVYFQVYRDAAAGGDTMTADARLLGIKFFFTTDAANDA